jgi:hypothetical protein
MSINVKHFITGQERAMTDQEKSQKQPTSDIETPAVDHTEQQSEQHDRLKETTEKIWGNTKHAWSTATFKANKYKKLVQKKIDQSSLHKKITIAHTDLGKLIDDLRENGAKNILNMVEVKEVLTRIDELKAASIILEEEVDRIRNEELPHSDFLKEEDIE